jgi:hypothetical protein
MDWHDSKLNGTVFGIHDWLSYLRDQAATYRKLVERADDPLVKTELLALVSVCEEVADNIEDHLTGGSDRAPRGPLSKLSWKRPPTDAALLLFLGMKRGLLRPHFPHWFPYPFKCEFVCHTQCQALIVLDLLVELDALVTHLSSAFTRTAVIGHRW